MPREILLDAAAAAIVERGYTGASLADIAGRVQLTKGAFAHHFPAKQHIATALLEHLTATITAAEDTARRGYPAGGAPAAIAFLLDLGHSMSVDVRVAAGIVLIVDPSTPAGPVTELLAGWIERMRGFFAEAAAQGQTASDADPTDIAEHVLVTSLGLAFVGPRLYTRPDQQRLRLLWLSLQSAGLIETDRVVDEVISTRANGALGGLPPSMGVPPPD